VRAQEREQRRGLARRLRGRELLVDQQHARVDHAERVLELLPDARRELAERGEPLRLPHAALVHLGVALEHEGELEVARLLDGRDAARRRARLAPLRGERELDEPATQPVHGERHVALGEADLDVAAPDAGRELERGRVEGAVQQPLHPLGEGELEPFDLRGVGEHGARVGVLEDDAIEIFDERGEDARQLLREPAQRGLVLRAEVDVGATLFEGSRHPGESTSARSRLCLTAREPPSSERTRR
jgi:hypothetical protein